MSEQVEFEALIGEHVFTGADSGILPANRDEDRWEEANVFRFVLDGVTYVATEDPSDGYRSSLGTLLVDISGAPVPAVPPVRVVVRKAPDDVWEKNDYIEGICIENGEQIFRVGTRNHDDYYPAFVGEFDPTKMPVNAEQR
jgi:hypothetical protein